MVKLGKVRLRTLMESTEPFGDACLRYHDNVLDDEAKADIEKYRNELLALGIERKSIDNYESDMKDFVTGVRECEGGEMREALETFLGEAVAAIGEKLYADGADIVISLTEKDEKRLEGFSHEILVMIEDMPLPIYVPKKNQTEIPYKYSLLFYDSVPPKSD